MKLKNLFLAAMTLFAFAACTDTPDSPYDFPTTGGNGGSNGGAVKIRIKHESKAMLKYLEEHTKG